MTKKIIDSKKKHETNGREMEQNKIKMKNKKNIVWWMGLRSCHVWSIFQQMFQDENLKLLL